MQTLSMRVQNECNSGLESEDELKEDPCFDLTSFQPWARDNVCPTIWSSLCTKMKLFSLSWSGWWSSSYCILQIQINIEN